MLWALCALRLTSTSTRIYRTDITTPTTISALFFSDLTSETISLGGAISIRSADGQTLLIKDCSFNDCTAKQFGGSIYVENVDFEITKACFVECRVTADESSGGCIYGASLLGEYMRISDCSFSSCSAGTGGCLYLRWSTNTDFEINSCSFTECCGWKTNGAVDVDVPGNITIRNSIFLNSQSPEHAIGTFLCYRDFSVFDSIFRDVGDSRYAFYVYLNKKDASRYWFENCTVDNEGHVGYEILWLRHPDNGGSALFYSMCFIDCQFIHIDATKNEWSEGAVIHPQSNNHGNLTCIRCLFDRARCTISGGAIHTMYMEHVWIEDCTFRECLAIKGWMGTGGCGGVLVEMNAQTARIIGCQFINNSSGIQSQSLQLTFGRHSWESGDVHDAREVRNCVFRDHVGAAPLGIIGFQDKELDHLIISGCEFRDNVVNTEHGLILFSY